MDPGERKGEKKSGRSKEKEGGGDRDGKIETDRFLLNKHTSQ